MMVPTIIINSNTPKIPARILDNNDSPKTGVDVSDKKLDTTSGVFDEDVELFPVIVEFTFLCSFVELTFLCSFVELIFLCSFVELISLSSFVDVEFNVVVVKLWSVVKEEFNFPSFKGVEFIFGDVELIFITSVVYDELIFSSFWRV